MMMIISPYGQLDDDDDNDDEDDDEKNKIK